MFQFTSFAAAAALFTITGAVPVHDLGSRDYSTATVNQTTCNGKSYVYESLAGYGDLPSNSRDKFGDTLGGLGSAIALEQSSWKMLKNGSYTGTLWSLPDRGWNTEGTLNFNPRVHKFKILLNPTPTTENSPPNLILTYLDSMKFSGPDGTPTTGLDPDVTGSAEYPGFPSLPIAHYTGDGFGGAGPGGARIPIDSEGIVLNKDGSFWISDEYGPYIYHFSKKGRMLSAIQPPAAILPYRNGSDSYSAASPPRYNPDLATIPEDPDSGRSNNQGFEGLTVSEDGNTLYALLQSATTQEGGLDNASRRYARLVAYDIRSPTKPKYKSEKIVPLPLYKTKKGKDKVAAQSEIHALDNGQFFILSRDSGAGTAADDTLSRYRQIDVFDVSKATNIKSGSADKVNGSVASPAGVLDSDVTPAQYCSFLDFNVNSQLSKFGLHNGGDQDAGLLNEKWESIALADVNPGKKGSKKDGKDVFVFSFSDNDFITQDGALKGGQFKYSDESGYNVGNQALVFKVRISA